MMRDPVAVKEPPASAMNCEDARDWFAALLGGRIGLTEWALVEAHLRQCAECQQEEARLQQLATARRFVTPPRAVLASLGKTMEVTRIGVTRSIALVVRRRALLTAAALELTPRAIAGVMQAVSLGIGHSADRIARLRALLAIALELAARPIAGAIQAIGLGITRSVAGIAHLPALLAIPLRLSVRAVANAIEALRLDIGHSADLIARLRALLAIALELTARTIAGAIQAIGLGITRSVAGIAHRPALLAIPLRLSVRAMANAIEAARLGITRSVKRAILFRPSERAAGAVLALAFALYALPFLPPPSVEQGRVARAPSRIDDPRQSPSRAAALSSPRVPASEAARGASLRPVPVRGSLVSATHVVGRLLANDRSAAERDFTALLASVGGTELGRRHRLRFTAVEVIVPQFRYNEFADGLARIGSWRLRAACFPLPDAVHMTIRVSE